MWHFSQEISVVKMTPQSKMCIGSWMKESKSLAEEIKRLWTGGWEMIAIIKVTWIKIVWPCLTENWISYRVEGSDSGAKFLLNLEVISIQTLILREKGFMLWEKRDMYRILSGFQVRFY